MLVKRTKEIVRAVGEAAGVLAPSVPDAEQAAEQRRAELVAAQAAIVSAEAELDRLHDAGASPRDILAAEAKQADSRLNAEREQRACAAAERRLTAAREAVTQEGKTKAIKQRDAALEIRAQAAIEIDRLAALVAEQVKLYDAQSGPLSEAASAGVASRTFHIGGPDIARHALEKAGAFPSSWLGDKAIQPGAVDIATKHAGAVLADAPA